MGGFGIPSQKSLLCGVSRGEDQLRTPSERCPCGSTVGQSTIALIVQIACFPLFSNSEFFLLFPVLGTPLFDNS